MAILDTSKKPFIADRDDNVFVGIDYPFHRSLGAEGWFKGTTTTIEAVKTNIKMLLKTEKGERLMQPNLGISLRRFLFEQMTQETFNDIQAEIIDAFDFWLPFVEIRDVEVSNKSADSNSIIIDLSFNITKDPNTLDSVQVEIGD
jgi:phage baseplate assembly protein W|tara:strand:+ start:3742 stop:4176 length:435 start_codon:yes stop_codon:yes gene_type:complete